MIYKIIVFKNSLSSSQCNKNPCFLNAVNLIKVSHIKNCMKNRVLLSMGYICIFKEKLINSKESFIDGSIGEESKEMAGERGDIF